MNRRIYGESVRGASHIRTGKECQDSFKKLELSDETAVIAVADGHGSDSCPYSKTGSVIAVNVFCQVLQNLIKNFDDDREFLLTYLNREGEIRVAQAIEEEWKKRIWKNHNKHKREKQVNENGELDKDAVYRQYGTTLLGLVVTCDFIFAFQLGDGDILFVDAKTVQPVIEGDKILGTETHSLCRRDAWKKAISTIRRRTQEDTCLYLMSTDGFANSYSSEEEFKKTCRDYYLMIQEHGFDTVSANLKSWLSETSELGCGDDITVVLSYYEGGASHE
jgi:serine/threonine protein phosphatase PrpC